MVSIEVKHDNNIQRIARRYLTLYNSMLIYESFAALVLEPDLWLYS